MDRLLLHTQRITHSIFTPHRLQAVHKMRPIAIDFTHSMVCVLGTRVSCAKKTEPIGVPFEGG